MAGNSSSANDAGSVDVTAPTLTVDAPALTNDATPTITGTTNLPAGSTVSLVVTDALGTQQTLTATVAAGGTYSASVPAALAEGSFTVVATATDAAGNSASANDAGAVDVTAPSITVDAPLLTNDSTPTITGTTDLPAGSIVSVTDAAGASQTLAATVAAGARSRSTCRLRWPRASLGGGHRDRCRRQCRHRERLGHLDLTAPTITVDARH
ncbi:hypothetical protein FSC37_05370 [Piscinibacter aquaticus]|uniref:Bacterial Ig-like domain-containing protein n=1 Tax=Piscinibacter aquaticus TaxID=392597 RepID=A0A5C6U1P3_9BURK|nr:hypothetical protein FSC37_05370 [Piscinibacter aquaticus]